MNIVGRTKIFRNEREGKVYYTTSVSNKNKDGQREYMTVDIQLPRDTELENKTDIDITNGFLSFYKTKNGLPKIKYVVMDYIIAKDEDSLPF
jgi:hypothetical protein